MALTYDFKQVIATYNGFQIQGFAEGTGINAERNEDSWTMQIGADGEGTRSKSNNKGGRVTFTLMQSSASNDVLSAFAQTDELSNGGSGPLLIKDLSGRSLLVAEQAWVVKPPACEFGSEAGPREWILETDNLVMSVAGN